MTNFSTGQNCLTRVRDRCTSMSPHCDGSTGRSPSASACSTTRSSAVDDHSVPRDCCMRSARTASGCRSCALASGSIRATSAASCANSNPKTWSPWCPIPMTVGGRTARLTDSGLLERAVLDGRSEELAQRIVAPLSAYHQAELSAALDRAERLLRAATTTLDVVDPGSEQAVSAMTQYFEELDQRFPTGFDAGDSLVVDDAVDARPQWHVRRCEQRWRCGGMRRREERGRHDRRDQADVGSSRHPRCRHRSTHARASGAGRRRARVTRVVLDTNTTLLEAIAMYQRAGYVAIERYNDNPYAGHWFTKALG